MGSSEGKKQKGKRNSETSIDYIDTNFRTSGKKNEDTTVLNNGEIYVMLIILTCVLAVINRQMRQLKGNTKDTEHRSFPCWV